MASSAQAPRALQVLDGLARLDGMIDNLEMVRVELFKRLEPVMSAPQIETKLEQRGPGVLPVVPLVGIAERISVCRRRIEEVAESMQELLKRLEI